MKKNSISIIDIERMHAQHPETFHILPRTMREPVAMGSIVKLIFESRGSEHLGERMWVIVRECLPGETYIGELINQPISSPSTLGDWFRFGPENILDIGEQVVGSDGEAQK